MRFSIHKCEKTLFCICKGLRATCSFEILKVFVVKLTIMEQAGEASVLRSLYHLNKWLTNFATNKIRSVPVSYLPSNSMLDKVCTRNWYALDSDNERKNGRQTSMVDVTFTSSALSVSSGQVFFVLPMILWC